MWLDKLKEMKEAADLTTHEIAFLSKIPEPTLEKIFAATTKDPKLETMRQLVHFLGYTLDDLEDRPLPTKKNSPLEEGGLSESELRLVALYRQLNQEGQEKLLDLADDIVSSGKYIKSDSSKLGKAKGA